MKHGFVGAPCHGRQGSWPHCTVSMQSQPVHPQAQVNHSTRPGNNTTHSGRRGQHCKISGGLIKDDKSTPGPTGRHAQPQHFSRVRAASSFCPWDTRDYVTIHPDQPHSQARFIRRFQQVALACSSHSLTPVGPAVCRPNTTQHVCMPQCPQLQGDKRRLCVARAMCLCICTSYEYHTNR